MAEKVIIIDDDEDLCLLMRRWLVQAGFQVTYHTSPFGAVNAVQKGDFDLVVLDINMPALDGPHLLKLMRETKGLEGVRVLLCSFLEDDALRAVAIQAGVGSYISKSAPQSEFVDAVRSALSAAPSAMSG